MVDTGHRPLYCSTHGGNDIPGGNAVLKKAVEDVLMNNHVSMSRIDPFVVPTRACLCRCPTVGASLCL